MKIVPLKAAESQEVQIVLADQLCQIKVYQKLFGLFMDLAVDNVPIINGVICENLNKIVRSLYLGFVGDFVFIDTIGSDDPFWDEIGSRFQLVYLTPEEVAQAEADRVIAALES